jgi:capsular polysaccharide biosynthesis protein
MQIPASGSNTSQSILEGLDYLSILRQQRRIIFACLAFFLLAAVAVRLVMPAKYESRVVTIPASTESGPRPAALDALASLGVSLSSGSASPKEVAVATLNSHAFLLGFIHRENLLPILFPTKWDSETKTWKSAAPTDEDAFDRLSGAMAVDSSPTDNLVIVRVRWTDATTATSIANRLVRTLNRQFQSKSVTEADHMIAYLTEAYKNIQISEVRTNIANLIQDQIRQRIMAQSRDEFTLTIVDPAFPTTKRVTPGLSILLPIGLFLGLLFGIPGAFLAHTVKPRWPGPLARLLGPRP